MVGATCLEVSRRALKHYYRRFIRADLTQKGSKQPLVGANSQVVSVYMSKAAIFHKNEWSCTFISNNTVRYHNIHEAYSVEFDVWLYGQGGKTYVPIKFCGLTIFNIYFSYRLVYLGQNMVEIDTEFEDVWYPFITPTDRELLKPLNAARESVVVLHCGTTTHVALKDSIHNITVPIHIFEALKGGEDRIVSSVVRSLTDSDNNYLVTDYNWFTVAKVFEKPETYKNIPIVPYLDNRVVEVENVDLMKEELPTNWNEEGNILIDDEPILVVEKPNREVPGKPINSVPIDLSTPRKDSPTPEKSDISAQSQTTLEPSGTYYNNNNDNPYSEPILRLPVKKVVVEDKRNAIPEAVTRVKAQSFCLATTMADVNIKRNAVKCIGDPLISPAWKAPVVSIDEIKRMVNLRYHKYPQQWNSKTEPFYIELAEEFANILSHPTTVAKVNHDVVRAKQTKPSQRNIIRRGECFKLGLVKTTGGFVKGECYSVPKPVRPIINAADLEKEEYSTYTLAVGGAFKDQPDHFHWYGFGNNLKITADKIATKASRAQMCVETDFTAFDVTVNALCRYVEARVLDKLFKGDPLAQKLHSSQFNRTLHFNSKDNINVSVNSGYGRQSGSADTSIGNSIINAFVAYVVFRKAGLSPLEAWAKLGIYGGDDGVTFDCDPKLYYQVCEEMGLRIKLKIIKRGEPFNFLARVYRHWDGAPCNSCVLERALGHFHFTPSSASFTNAEFFYLKSMAFLLTEPGNPIIEPLMLKINNLAKPSVGKKTLKITEDIVTQKLGAFDYIYNTRIVDFLGLWDLQNHMLCAHCIKDIRDDVKSKTKNLEKWEEQVEACNDIKNLPQLLFDVLDEPFSQEFVVFDYDANIDVMKERTLIQGTEPKLPTYPNRTIQEPKLFNFLRFKSNPVKTKKKGGVKQPKVQK